MNKVKFLSLVFCVALTGCRSGSSYQPSWPRDNLVGWYNLPTRNAHAGQILASSGTLIPVFKRGGKYYSVCRGAEVLLKPSPSGLEWGIEKSSMKGTMIGQDPATKIPYIIIEDRNAQGDFAIGEKQFLTPISKPAGLLGADAKSPTTNDDFIGCYIPIWLPSFRWVVSRNGDRYQLEGQVAEGKTWKIQKSESAELVPLGDQLGFSFNGKKEAYLVFSREAGRYECSFGAGSARMPLAKVSSSVPVGTGILTPPVNIGIPAWH